MQKYICSRSPDQCAEGLSPGGQPLATLGLKLSLVLSQYCQAQCCIAENTSFQSSV